MEKISNVMEIKSYEEERELYRIGTNNRLPVIFIIVFEEDNFVKFTYDMITTPNDQLSKEAVEKINNLITSELKFHSKLIPYGWGEEEEAVYGFGTKTACDIQEIPLNNCRKLANLIYPIVMNPSNWETYH